MDKLDISIDSTTFLSSFELIYETTIDTYQKDKLNLFTIKINANEFNYSNLEEQLLDPLINYAVSRKIKEQYSNSPGKLSKLARKKFRDYRENSGELGELLLYCFLESHLKAPKILSKLELKTSSKMYVNGADGVHYLKLENGDYQLIFGESKMHKDLKSAFDNAIKSIYEFKNEVNSAGDSKSGIRYEKTLISDNISKEIFSDEDKDFLTSLLYPSENTNYYVDDAFGIFIGFEITVSEEEKCMRNAEFRNMIHRKIIEQVKDHISKLEEKIMKYGLQGHDFYIYVVPFTNIDETRKKVLEEVVS